MPTVLVFGFQNCSGGFHAATGVQTEASINAPPGNPDGSATYAWVGTQWGSCSILCGGGTHSRSVNCTKSDGSVVADSFCTLPKPALSESCNTQTCDSYMWIQGGFSPCSVTCGGGTQSQSVMCENNQAQVVANSFCTASEPATSQQCNTQTCACQPGAQTTCQAPNGALGVQTCNAQGTSWGSCAPAVSNVCTSCISFQVSAPQAVFWPGPFTQSVQQQFPDNLFTVVAFPDHFVGYIAEGSSWAMSATSVYGLSINNLNTTPVITRGLAGQFDECNASIHAADLIPGTNSVRAWYHAESGYCHGETGTNEHPTKSIGFAQSGDGGMTFSKPNYPNNVVLSGAPAELAQASGIGPVVPGDGDFSLVEVGNLAYLFFGDSYTNASSVAVATVQNAGTPGSWLKWYGNSFSQPGLGGLDSDIGPKLAGVSYNTATQSFMGMTYQNSLGVGFNVATSSDSTSWTVINAPLIPTGVRYSDADGDGNNSYGFALYPSMVAPDGSKNWGNTFYLYYMYLRPGDNFSTRFMVVSQVTMQVGSSPVNSPQASTALERYYSSSAGHWITSGMAVPENGTWDYVDEGRLGGEFTLAGAGLVELDECVYGSEHYFVSTDPTGTCEGTQKLRTSGWIYSPALSQPAGTHAIYRCYSPGGGDHFVSVDPTCEGNGNVVESMLGYALN